MVFFLLPTGTVEITATRAKLANAVNTTTEVEGVAAATINLNHLLPSEKMGVSLLGLVLLY